MIRKPQPRPNPIVLAGLFPRRLGKKGREKKKQNPTLVLSPDYPFRPPNYALGTLQTLSYLLLLQPPPPSRPPSPYLITAVPMLLFATLPFLKPAIEFFFVALIVALLVFSLVSICFILVLKFKSRTSIHLQNFNSLWTVRFLLVVLITFWAFSEVIRLRLFRTVYLYPLFPKLTPHQQANFCKIHVVLSLGFFEPGFLVILLFLLDVSVKKQTPKAKSFFSFFYVLAFCLPLSFLQVYFVFLGGGGGHRSWHLDVNNGDGDDAVLCAYPLLSTVVFGAFGVVFILSFLVSFWKVVSHVINKALKFRIFALGLTVIVGLPLQILLMGLSAFWTPEEPGYDVFAMSIFLTTLVLGFVGEGILVIKPIVDSLAVGDGCVEQRSTGDSPMKTNTEGGVTVTLSEEFRV